MKANELRLNNYVNFKNRDDIHYCEIIELYKTGCHLLRNFKDGINNDDQPEAIKDLTGIPLTEQWLLDFGFKQDESIWNSLIIYFKEQFIIYKQDNIWWYNSALGDSVELKYVHQLQNLYLALTGKELTK